MKRLIIILLTFLLVFTLASCSSLKMLTKDGEGGGTHTEASETEPDSEETAEPTSPPPPSTGVEDYCMELETEKLYSVDLDYDGLPDTVYIEAFPAEDELFSYRVNVGIATKPGRLCIRDVKPTPDFHVWIVDCDPSDSRLEVLISFSEDGVWMSEAIRVREAGGDTDRFTDYLHIRDDLASNFSSDGGFIAFSSTKILGSSALIAKMKVDRNGFHTNQDDFTYYSDSDQSLSLKLKRNMDAVLLNSDGTDGEEYTIPKGDTIIAVRTDRSTYVIVCLPDGRLARVSIEIRDGEVYIGDRKQDKYGNIQYD